MSDDLNKPCPACGVLVRELEKRMEQKFKEIDRREAEGNKFREQISDERVALMRKDDYEVRHEQLIIRIASIEKWQSRMVGATTLIIVLVGFLGATIGVIWGHIASGG